MIKNFSEISKQNLIDFKKISSCALKAIVTVLLAIPASATAQDSNIGNETLNLLFGGGDPIEVCGKDNKKRFCYSVKLVLKDGKPVQDEYGRYYTTDETGYIFEMNLTPKEIQRLQSDGLVTNWSETKLNSPEIPKINK